MEMKKKMKKKLETTIFDIGCFVSNFFYRWKMNQSFSLGNIEIRTDNNDEDYDNENNDNSTQKREIPITLHIARKTLKMLTIT